MEDLFVPFEIAFQLKELGFDERCFTKYYESGKLADNLSYLHHNHFGQVNAPTYQQAFHFFREKYNLFHEIQIDQTTYPKFCFKIVRFIGNPKDLTEKEWGWEQIPNDANWSLFRTYEEAELACLQKLIEIVK